MRSPFDILGGFANALGIGLSSSGPAVSPPPNAYFRLPAPSAGADGDRVTSWADVSGNSRTFTESSGNAPRLRIENGQRVVATEGVSTNRTKYTPAVTKNFTAFTVHFYAKMNAINSNYTLLSLSTGYSGNFFSNLWTVPASLAFGLASGNDTSPSYHSNTTAYSLFTITFDGSLYRVYHDGGEIGKWIGEPIAGTAASASSFNVTEFGYGYWAPGASGNNNRCAEWGVWEACHTQDEIISYRDYLRATYPLLPCKALPVVTWIGNSLSTGIYSGMASSVPYLACQPIAGPVRWIGGGRSARTTPQLTARITGDYSHYQSGVTGRKVAVFWEGRNDVTVNGASAATAWANLQAAAAALYAAGYEKIVMGTVLPSNDLNDTTRASLNALIVAGAGTTYDHLADVAADATIGEDGDNANTTYYSDGVHMKAAGNAIAAPIFQTAIEAALA